MSVSEAAVICRSTNQRFTAGRAGEVAGVSRSRRPRFSLRAIERWVEDQSQLAHPFGDGAITNARIKEKLHSYKETLK